jgi:hypothetical protein
MIQENVRKNLFMIQCTKVPWGWFHREKEVGRSNIVTNVGQLTSLLRCRRGLARPTLGVGNDMG